MIQDIPQKAVELVKQLEGLRLRAYPDQGGVWTIGYGHTGKVVPGMTITQEKADALLEEDLETALHWVKAYVHVPLNEGQLSALLSFVLNIGGGEFKAGSVPGLLNAGQHPYLDVPPVMMEYRLVKGKVDKGLIARRIRECHVFMGEPDV
jgi:lysozyme